FDISRNSSVVQKGSSHPRQPSCGFPHPPSTSTCRSHVVHQWESSAMRLTS
ncbi:hypothetical protein BC826DRAFT_1020432, partial [Russula brevipes]